jgi:hypothetical protein
VVGFAALVIAASALPAAATYTAPATNPFNVPGDAAGVPQSFTVTVSGFSPGQTGLVVEECDGVASTAPGWSPTTHCDNGTSPSPATADGNGVVTFPANDPNFGFTPVKGNMPSHGFNCIAPSDPPSNNGHPDFTNCQVRVSSNNAASTSDQQFLTMVMPAAIVPTAPVPQNQALTVGTSSVTTITLTATPDPANATNGYQLTVLPAHGTITVNGNPAAANTAYAPNNGTSLNVVYTAPAAATPDTFSFQARDAAFAFGAGGTGVVTLQVGAAPVDQVITEQVNGGQLVLSCSAPGSPGYPALTCPDIALPAITLNGVTQTVNGAMNPIYVSDNRGSLTADWALSTYMVGTPSVTNCTTVDFCNSTAGADLTLPQNHIAAANLSITPAACAPAAGNLNPAATVGAGGAYGGAHLAVCNATHPNSGGTFTATGSFSLKIPASTASGLYKGTVEYLAA